MALLTPSGSSEVARIVSSSIAPVFLITGIAAVLSIMTLRYGRVIDRIRTLLRDGPKLYRKEIGSDHLTKELLSLYERAKRLRFTIILEVASICCISVSIMILFLGLSFGIEVPYAAIVFFILSLLLLIIGLLLFIRDFVMSLECIENDMNVRSHVDPSEGHKPPLSREHSLRGPRN
jgi:hypothetical protein